MTFDELKTMSDNDLKFDFNVVDDFIIKIPYLKQKYAKELMMIELKIEQLQLDLQEVKKELHEYYLTDYQVKIDRRDVDLYITGDKKFTDIVKKIAANRGQAKFVETIIKTLDNLSYTLPAAIKFHLWKNGE